MQVVIWGQKQILVLAGNKKNRWTSACIYPGQFSLPCHTTLGEIEAERK